MTLLKQRKSLVGLQKITVEEMCAEMVQSDLEKAKQHALLKKHGHHVSVATEG